MLIDSLRVKILKLRDQVKAKLPVWLMPFRGKYIDALTMFLLANLDGVQAAWNQFYESGDIHKFIDFVIDHARGNLPLPWYLAPFSGLVLEAVRQWLHLNADVLKDTVGDVVETPAPRLAKLALTELGG